MPNLTTFPTLQRPITLTNLTILTTLTTLTILNDQRNIKKIDAESESLVSRVENCKKNYFIYFKHMILFS